MIIIKDRGFILNTLILSKIYMLTIKTIKTKAMPLLTQNKGDKHIFMQLRFIFKN